MPFPRMHASTTFQHHQSLQNPSDCCYNFSVLWPLFSIISLPSENVLLFSPQLHAISICAAVLLHLQLCHSLPSQLKTFSFVSPAVVSPILFSFDTFCLFFFFLYCPPWEYLQFGKLANEMRSLAIFIFVHVRALYKGFLYFNFWIQSNHWIKWGLISLVFSPRLCFKSDL